jgi:hypothetical protein
MIVRERPVGGGLSGSIRRKRPLLKNEWVPLKIGPLLFIDRMVSNDAASYALVKAGLRPPPAAASALTKA